MRGYLKTTNNIYSLILTKVLIVEFLLFTTFAITTVIKHSPKISDSNFEEPYGTKNFIPRYKKKSTIVDFFKSTRKNNALVKNKHTSN